MCLSNGIILNFILWISYYGFYIMDFILWILYYGFPYTWQILSDSKLPVRWTLCELLWNTAAENQQRERKVKLHSSTCIRASPVRNNRQWQWISISMAIVWLLDRVRLSRQTCFSVTIFRSLSRWISPTGFSCWLSHWLSYWLSAKCRDHLSRWSNVQNIQKRHLPAKSAIQI